MGIQVCTNKGAGPFCGNFGYLKKIFSRTTDSNALPFGMEHPLDKRFKFAQIKFLGP